MKVKLRLSELQTMGYDCEVGVDLNISKYNNNSFSPDSLSHVALRSHINPRDFGKILTEYIKYGRRDNITESLIEEKFIKYLNYDTSSVVPKLLDLFTEYTKDISRPELFSQILYTGARFYNFRKTMLRSALRLSSSEIDYIKVLETFKLALDTESYQNIISHITDGKNNPEVRKILCGNKLEIFLCENDKERFKHITKYPSCVKYLDKPITISYQDLETIPPATRFKFLEMYYKDDFRLVNKCDTYRILRVRENFGRNNVILPRLSDTEIDALLFAVSINKNNRVNKFLQKYKNFQNEMSKITSVYIS